MKYYVLNKQLAENRWWCNRDDSPELILDVFNYELDNWLAKKGYELVSYDLDETNVNFDPTNPFKITVGYNTLNDIKDYFVIVLDDDTRLCYYLSKDDNIEIYNKEFEICKAKYVLDEWATFGNTFKCSLLKKNPKVLHRRKFKNRPLLNPRVNEKNENILIIDAQSIPTYDETEHEWHVLNSNWTWKLNNDQGIKYSFLDIKDTRDVKIKISFKNIVLRRDNGEKCWQNKFPWPNLDYETNLRLEVTTPPYVYHNIYDVRFNPDLNLKCHLNIKLYRDLIIEDGIQKLRINLRVWGEFSTGWHDDIKPTWVTWEEPEVKVWYDAEIIPPSPDPEDDDTPNLFYIDFQKQPWYNEKGSDENFELLPIEKKIYSSTDFYSIYFAKLNNLYTWDGHNSTLYSENGDESQQVKTLWTTQGSGTGNFTSPQINFHATQGDYKNDDATQQAFRICDDIFNNNGVYTYFVVQPSGQTSNNSGPYSPDKACANKTVWFLIPVAYKRFKDTTTGTRPIWGINNYKSMLKRISTIGAKESIVTVITSTIPPTLIAMSNKNVISTMWDRYWSLDSLPLVTVLPNYIGTFNYHYDNEDHSITTDIGVIPIQPKTIKFYMENNMFMTKTQDFLHRMNEHPYELPTVAENEPFFYSPNCLLTGIIPQNNNQKTYLGNDYLDLSYYINNLGIEALFLNNATFNYSANRLSQTKEISDSRNELAFDSGLPLPENTNAFTDWLNQNATTESTSWKVYQNNHNLRIIKGVLSGFDTFFNAPVGDMAGAGGGAMQGGGAAVFSILGAVSKSISRMLNWGGNLAGTIYADQNEKLRLNSQFSNIKASSGTNVSLPSYSASCFSDASGLIVYTLFVRPDQIDDIAIPRLTTGSPCNQVLTFNKLFNRKVFNIMAIDCDYNYVALKRAIKSDITNFLTKNDSMIDIFLQKYLTGVRLWNGGDYYDEPDDHDPYLVENNYEIDVWHTDEYEI